MEEAEEGSRIRMESGEGRLDPNWSYLSLTDLALKEARQLMEPESTTGASGQLQTAGPPGIKPDIP